MTRFNWRDLGGGARIASVPDADQCTRRIIVERPNEPPFIHRTTSMADDPPVRRFVIACPCCGAEVVVAMVGVGPPSAEQYAAYQLAERARLKAKAGVGRLRIAAARPFG
jgi:hypothetical protein